MTQKEQKLISLVFRMVLAATDDKVFCKKPRGERMAWVANNLRSVGYDTHPIGMEWGVIVDDKFREIYDIVPDNLDN